MISFKSALAFVLLLATSSKVAAFDAAECDVYVFRTQENALWHCGQRLPGESFNEWTSLYCDHSQGDEQWPWAWASDHPDDWCAFMIATVRQEHEDSYPLTENINITDTPGPNTWFFSTLVDWGCYMIENEGTPEAYTSASYLVNSRAGEHASDCTQQCERTINYFDYWNLHENIRDEKWWGDVPVQCKSNQRNNYRDWILFLYRISQFFV